jgi:hypothetical protein
MTIIVLHQVRPRPSVLPVLSTSPASWEVELFAVVVLGPPSSLTASLPRKLMAGSGVTPLLSGLMAFVASPPKSRRDVAGGSKAARSLFSRTSRGALGPPSTGRLL